MSHIASYATRLKLRALHEVGDSYEHDEGFQLLRRAVEVVAAELGGRVTSEIEDYFGGVKACDLAVRSPQFPAGVGITISRSTGEVRFVYDAYGGYEGIARDICERITQAFTSLAVVEALKELNYEVELTEAGDGARKQVLVKGVM